MDAFGWSPQPATAASSCPSDDALLAAFLGASTFDELHSAGTGDGTVSSDAYHGLDLPSCQNGVTLPGHGDAPSNVFLDSVGLLPAIAGAHHGFHDTFAFVPDEPAQADGSSAAFSGYSTTAGGGGNVSSGESNTYGGGGHETEVASPPCAVSRRVQITQVAPPPTKRNKMPDKHPAVGLTAMKTTIEAKERWGTNRAAAPTTSITFGHSGGRRGYEPDTEAIAQVKAMRPVSSLGAAGEAADASAEPSSSKPRRRKNMRISSDPQTMAARLRRKKVSERLRALQRLVPGGSKMDTSGSSSPSSPPRKPLGAAAAAVTTTVSTRRCSVTWEGILIISSRSSGGADSTVLAFERDGVAGYVKSNRNM